MARTANIFGRIRRNLNAHGYGISDDKVIDNYIYDEMQQAQMEIFSRAKVEKSFDITIVDGTEAYNLVATSRKVVEGIKELLTPSTWFPSGDYGESKKVGISLLPNNAWDDLKKASISNSYPLYYTIFDNQIRFNPTPGSSVDGDTVTVWAYLCGSETEIASGVEPELEREWDKAIEFFATAQFLKGKEREYFKAEFENEVFNKSSIRHTKHYEIRQIESTW